MASVITDPGGRRRIQFLDRDGNRKTIRLGVVDKRNALGFKLRVEKIAAAVAQGDVPDDETVRWINALSDKLHARLAAVGLVRGRDKVAVKLKGFLDGYIADRPDVKPATKTVYGHTRRNLVAFFGEDVLIRDITPGDADRWVTVHLVGKERLAPNTVRRRCGIAKQFFRVAMRRKLIPTNPFEDLKASVQANPDREFFLDRPSADRILKACPSIDWRLLFALARYGGLRTPSESLALRWADIDWERGRIRVTSPKTEHHAGKGHRDIPLFPELEPILTAALTAAPEGAEFVITKYRDPTSNLRTHFERIIKKAGLEPWPKLWQNLRATRETELAETYPIHVVCAWIGNSQAVAKKHYLQVTDSHFEQAAQNQAQQGAKSSETECNGAKAENENRPDMPSNSQQSSNHECSTMGDTGLEPVTSRV